MKIVLRQDVPKVGEAGTIQTVSNGYGRNYLIPQGLAVVATAGEIKVAEHNLAVKARKIVKQEEQMQSLADRIAGQRLEFIARAGEQGRLYGSITAGDVAERLSAAIGEEIDRRKVVLDESIRTVGTYTVAVHLVGRLRPQVTVVVTGEVDESAAAVDAERAPDATAEAETAPEPTAEAETTSDTNAEAETDVVDEADA
ncbi:MAG: 50S ribosomal protein L9 [Chloroflexia bacterium]|nr:50S ribosomal protein L9 [Chloroflexia bacterium]MDQ3410640.1 50S ribosomal protein L9 [Chloroflexota bacterium]